MAQKFSTSNLPPKLAAEMVRPLSVGMEKSGSRVADRQIFSRRVVDDDEHEYDDQSTPISTCKSRYQS